MGRLFGTDGVRGIANTELSCELAMNIGRASAYVLTRHLSHKPKIVIGKDTRISSDMLEAALTAGLSSVGADVILLGVLPTPAVAYLVNAYHADAGIMISASHNPAKYNGIKIFDSKGYKLPDDMENEIESVILDDSSVLPIKVGGELGTVTHCFTAVQDYTDHLASTVQMDLSGMKVAFDCSNGSASATAQKLFSRYGAQTFFLNDQPDGININLNCGSTHMESLQQFVRAEGCDVGFAFDGDADRCLAVDANGHLIDGDQIIAIFSKFLKDSGRLKNNAAVVTVMTNMGFGKFARENEIKMIATKVGDRYVLEEMLKGGYNIGGEQSGHVIFLDYATTGDGQLTALWLLYVLSQTNQTAEAAAKIMRIYPQVMINIPVANDKKGLLDTDPAICESISYHQTLLGADGRILVRASGTEPLVRVMIEGSDFEQIQTYAQAIADVIREKTNV